MYDKDNRTLTTNEFKKSAIFDKNKIREEMISATSLEELEYIRKKYIDEIDDIFCPIFEDMVNKGHHFGENVGKVIN